MKLPIPYQIILKRLWDNSYGHKNIELQKAKQVLTFICRIPKNLVTPVFMEMKDMKLLEFENGRSINLLKKTDCEIIPRHLNRYKI